MVIKMKAVIVAGGKGIRMAQIYPDIPKPMIPIAGVPVLEREIECLKKQGITDFIITLQHKADVIMDYFGNGEKHNINIEYYVETEPLGNAGALYFIKDRLKEDFLLVNADSLFDIGIQKFARFHKETKALATIFVHPNDHPYDSGLIQCDRTGKVTKWIPKEAERERYYHNLVNAGIHILSPALLHRLTKKGRIDLDCDILIPLVNEKKLYAYRTPEYIKDMGTPERLRQVEDDFAKGLIEKKNLLRRQKAVFLDRDGTINRYVGFLRDIDDFELIDGVSDAIRAFRSLGYLVIVVTNQPVIARGEMTVEELKQVHKKMETLLGKEGTYIDDLFYCPHHPQKGFKGEIPEYKVECECRKPKPGMLLEAAAKYNIDLNSSWMVGDSETDITAGKNAGCKTCFLTEDYEKDYGQNCTAGSLMEFADMLKGKKDAIKDKRLIRYVDDLIVRYPGLGGIKEAIERGYQMIEDSYAQDGKLLVAGNGGSAADSEHIAGELMKSFKLPRPLNAELKERLICVSEAEGRKLADHLEYALTAIPLASHGALLTAYINDVNAESVFAQQVLGYGRAGDVFLAISTSGNSENILNAAVTAKAIGIKVIGLTGQSGGKLEQYADCMIKAPETEAYRIQELHLPIYHTICGMLEAHFFSHEDEIIMNEKRSCRDDL